METGPHCAVLQYVGESDQRHSLVVCQVSAHHRVISSFGHSLAGVIERFVETVNTLATGRGELRKVLRRRIWVDHGRQCSGVRRDNQIFAESALIPQSRHAKSRVWI